MIDLQTQASDELSLNTKLITLDDLLIKGSVLRKKYTYTMSSKIELLLIDLGLRTDRKKIAMVARALNDYLVNYWKTSADKVSKLSVIEEVDKIKRTYSLPVVLEEQLGTLGTRVGLSKSEMINRAVHDYINRTLSND